MTSLRPYAEYKSSGIAWLGDIPGHWTTRRIGGLGEFVSGSGFPHEHQGTLDSEIPFLKVSDMNLVGNHLYIRSWTNSVDRSLAKHLGARIIERNSIVFPKIGGALLTNKRRQVETPFCIDNNMMAFVPHQGRLDYWYQALLLIDMAQLVNPGPVPSLDVRGFKDLRLPLPPLDEQRAIAAFLDLMDARITRFIDARRRMIALLEEQKQAIITQAVTRGLDPDVPMKPSGIDWLGEIPAHWELRRSRNVFREVDKRAKDESLPRLSMSQRLGLVETSKVEAWRMQSESSVGSKIVDQNDLVLNRLKAHLAVFACAPITGTVSPDYTVLRAMGGANPKYFEALYKSPGYREEFYKRARGIVEGFWRLYTDDFYGVPVPWPPHEEQNQLVAFVDRAAHRLKVIVDQASCEIDLIQEYRTRLISDVVTGKLDVRGAELGELPEFEEVPGVDESSAPEDETDPLMVAEYGEDD